jgi:hypothetical protein
LRLKLTTRRSLSSDDYLVEAKVEGMALAYGVLKGRKVVALDQNVPRLRKAFQDAVGDAVLTSYVFEADDDV